VSFCLAVWDHDWNHLYRSMLKDSDRTVAEACAVPLNQVHYLLAEGAERTTKIATKEDWERFKRDRAARKGKK
jgi:hypothetical protein